MIQRLLFSLKEMQAPRTRNLSIRLEPGQIPTFNAAENACRDGGWMQLCFCSIPDGKLSTRGYNVDISGGMGAIASDYDVRTVL